MIGTFILSALAFQQASANPPVLLERAFKKGETLNYSVKSHLYYEERQTGLDTFIPQEQGYDYNFSIAVESVEGDGIAKAIYSRPTMTQVLGETFSRPETRKLEKVNWKYRVTLSPYNKVLNMEDLSQKPKPKPKSGSKNVMSPLNIEAALSQLDLSQFTGEIFRLAIFAGPLDSALDIAPPLPFDEVQPGTTWKHTVGYTPQRLKGSSKSAVQRLDYLYSYGGLMGDGAKKFHRVNGKLDLDTDASEFINQMMGIKKEQSQIKGFKLKLKTSIDYDLDPTTRHTLKAMARSEGVIVVDLAAGGQTAKIELNLKGESDLNLVSRK